LARRKGHRRIQRESVSRHRVDTRNDIVGVFLSVWTWGEGVTPDVFSNPPLLSPASFQDMVTAAAD